MKLFVLLLWLGLLNELECIQCPEHCKACSSITNCLQCNSGYKGNTCEEKCSNCKEGTKCKQDTGYCEESCKVGKSGEMCDIYCNSTCMSCERYDKSNCTTCAHDRYGNACNNECPSKCRNNTCNETDGTCTDGCTQRFWGHKCEKPCTEYCINCDRNGSCLECEDGNILSGYNCSKVKTQNKTAEIVVGVTLSVLALFSIFIFIKKRKTVNRLRKTVIRLFQRSQRNIVKDPEDPDECRDELLPSRNQGCVNQLTSKSNNYFEINVHLKNKMSLVRIDTVAALKEENLGDSLWAKAWEKECHKIVMFTDKVESEELREMFREKVKQEGGEIAIQYNGQETFCKEYFVKPFKMIKGEHKRQLLVSVFHYNSSLMDSMVSPLILLHRDMTRKMEFDGPTLVFSSKEDFRYGTYIAYDDLEMETTNTDPENIKPTEANQKLPNLEKQGLKLDEEQTEKGKCVLQKMIHAMKQDRQRNC